MKKRVNPAAIGIFIAGAVVVLLASLVVFGSGRFFRQTKDRLLTFREPVTGLEPGAPVRLMGVTIGRVKRIFVQVEEKLTNALVVSVVIEIDIKSSKAVLKNYAIDLEDREQFDNAVNKMGLRARLELASLLSGQLYISLDLFPREPGFVLDRESRDGLWQIPTLPSAKRQMVESVLTSLNNFTEFDFKGSSEELKGLLVDLRAQLAKLRLGEATTNLSETLVQAKTLLSNPLLKEAITNLNLSLAQIRQLGETLNTNINPLLAEARADLAQAGTMFDEAVHTLRQLKVQVEPDSTLSRELIRTLDEASAALNAVRQLADQLERNPSSLITGKKPSNP
jgi:paraquat-inducible protein B